MKIIVKINQKTEILEINKLETIYTIKVKLSRTLNINLDRIILKHDNRELDDKVMLMYEDLKDMSIVNATVVNDGGQKNIILKVIIFLIVYSIFILLIFSGILQFFGHILLSILKNNINIVLNILSKVRLFKILIDFTLKNPVSLLIFSIIGFALDKIYVAIMIFLGVQYINFWFFQMIKDNDYCKNWNNSELTAKYSAFIFLGVTIIFSLFTETYVFFKSLLSDAGPLREKAKVDAINSMSGIKRKILNVISFPEILNGYSDSLDLIAKIQDFNNNILDISKFEKFIEQAETFPLKGELKLSGFDKLLPALKSSRGFSKEALDNDTRKTLEKIDFLVSNLSAGSNEIINLIAGITPDKEVEEIKVLISKYQDMLPITTEKKLKRKYQIKIGELEKKKKELEKMAPINIPKLLDIIYNDIFGGYAVWITGLFTTIYILVKDWGYYGIRGFIINIVIGLLTFGIVKIFLKLSSS